jgi:hypothetical protein
VFIVLGTDDRATAQQFPNGARIYFVAAAASVTYLLLLVIGIVIAWRRGDRVGLPLLLILYVPATIAFVLTNMRYSVTVQPVGFMFVAVTVVTTLEQMGILSTVPAAQREALNL